MQKPSWLTTRDAAPLSRLPDLHSGDLDTAMTTVDERHQWLDLGEDFGLLQVLLEGMAIVGIADMERAPTTRPSFNVVTIDTFLGFRYISAPMKY